MGLIINWMVFVCVTDLNSKYTNFSNRILLANCTEKNKEFCCFYNVTMQRITIGKNIYIHNFELYSRGFFFRCIHTSCRMLCRLNTVIHWIQMEIRFYQHDSHRTQRYNTLRYVYADELSVGRIFVYIFFQMYLPNA